MDPPANQKERYISEFDKVMEKYYIGEGDKT
jgi:hypothetical protein